MSNRLESSELPINPKDHQPESSYREIVQQNAIDLGIFLSGSRIDFVQVTSVLPSAEVGISFTVNIGRNIRDLENHQEVYWYSADSASIHLLHHSLELMSKKKRKKNKQVVDNLKLIETVALDPFNWNKPFNPDLAS